LENRVPWGGIVVTFAVYIMYLSFRHNAHRHRQTDRRADDSIMSVADWLKSSSSQYVNSYRFKPVSIRSPAVFDEAAS